MKYTGKITYTDDYNAEYYIYRYLDTNGSTQYGYSATINMPNNSTYNGKIAKYNNPKLYICANASQEFPMSLLINNPTLLMTNDGLYCVIDNSNKTIYIYDLYYAPDSEMELKYDEQNYRISDSFGDSKRISLDSNTVYYCGLSYDDANEQLYTTKINPYILGNYVYFDSSFPIYNDNIEYCQNGQYRELNSNQFTNKLYTFTLPYKRQYYFESDQNIRINMYVGNELSNSTIDINKNGYVTVDISNKQLLGDTEYIKFIISPLDDINIPTYIKVV